MALLEKLFLIFIFIFPTGVIARFEFSNGVALTLNDIFLLGLICLWGYSKFKDKYFSKYFLLKPAGIFIIIALVSLILNIPNLGLIKFLISGSYLLRFIGYFLLYFIVKDFSVSFKKMIMPFLFCSGFLVIIIGYLQYFFFPSLKSLFNFGWDEHLYRMVSVFLDPNFAGAFFNIYLIFSIEYLRGKFKNLTKVKRLFLLTVPLLTLFAIYLTYSRSALLMLITVAIIYLIQINKKKVLGITVVLLILLIFISPRAFQTEGTNIFRIASSQQRIISLQVALKVIQSNPLLGVGFNAYRYAQSKFGLSGVYWQVSHAGAGTDASLLFVLATTGFIGLISFIYFLTQMLYLSRLNINKTGIILFSVLIGLLVDSIFVNSLFYVFILEWIFILAGITENS